jgi:hypothetical protein
MRQVHNRAFALLAVALLCTFVSADASTLQDPNYQRAVAEYLRLHRAQLERADAAWDREMAREKAGDCVEAGKKGQQPYNACLGKEQEITKANYGAYSAALRAIFAIADPNVDYDVPGATGRRPRPEDATRRFDQIEADWTTYLDRMCSLAEDRWRGGTIAPSQGSKCEMKLIRNHMRELSGILGWDLHM